MSVVRIDKYTVEVDGNRVSANESQEARLRAMSSDERARFVAIMGGKS